MALSEKELLLLDCFMYSDIAPNSKGKTLGDVLEQFVDKKTGKITADMLKSANIGAGKSVEFSGGINATEMADVMTQMLDDENLTRLRIAQTTEERKGGIRAACFYDDTTGKATVAFRGTGGSVEQWYNNLEGYGEVSTGTQDDAVDFINSLPYDKIDVTGHSNGGGQAMYVTVMCGDKIERCVSYEGQGVSDEFILENVDKVIKNRDKIKNISAHNDPVNTALFSIAGESIYVKSNDDIFSHGAYTLLKANEFDENGNFTNDSIVEQDLIFKIVHKLTISLEVASGMPGGEFWEYFADIIGIASGFIVKKENLDDLENWRIAFDLWVESTMDLIFFPTRKAIEDFNELVNIVTFIYKKIFEQYNEKFNDGRKYAVANPTILVDTFKLYNYSSRLNRVNQRIASLDSRLDTLYRNVCSVEDLIGTANALWNLLQADILTKHSTRLKKCGKYLEETAADFEKTEKSIVNKAL